MADYDFCGWATKNNLKCADGRIIRAGAFKVNDGKKVPVVWNHQHNSVSQILGHAILRNKNEGVYAYCSLNDSPAGKDAKEAVKHGDVEALSIWANQLQQDGADVLHGVIREVSLVLAGSNPGAFIESVLVHGEPMEDYESEGLFYTGEGIVIESELQHSEPESGEDIKHADNSKSDKKNDDGKPESDKTLGDVYNLLTDEQKTAVAIIVGQAVSDAKSEKIDNEGDEKRMAHNIFDQDPEKQNTTNTRHLSHAEGMAIIELAKTTTGSLKKAYHDTVGDDVIIHAIPTTGMNVPGAGSTQDYGIRGIESLYPDYRSMNPTPEIISRDMTWVQKVLSGIHKLPYEKIKSVFADITEDEARAKGYIKGTQKWPEVFSVLNRSTSGQTIYKLQKLDRDDIISITEFELVPWVKQEMQIMLDEEKARAILIGDGRLSTDRFKIKEENIRPIVNDVDLFNVKVKVNPAKNATTNDVAKKTIKTIIKKRKRYKGSGDPTLFITEDALSEMLLLEDKIGHPLYKTMAELATALRVRDIVTVEPMTGYKIDGEELVGIIVNLNDYAVGQNPKGKRDIFSDFDIDYNKETYLIEERLSGALRKPFSALTITLAKGFSFVTDEDEDDDNNQSGGDDGNNQSGGDDGNNQSGGIQTQRF